LLPTILSKIRKEFTIWSVGTLPGIVAIGLIVFLRLNGAMQLIEWVTFDSFLRLRPSEPIDERIVIVGIDEANIRRIRNYPIPDREIAKLLRTLQKYQPRVIGLDIVRDIPVEPGHAELVAAFKDIKNPQHLTVSPQFHWTDHKIRIHYFICVLGYLLSALLLNDAQKKGFVGSLNHLIDSLSNIRLCRSVTCFGKQGRPKIEETLEEMSKEQQNLMQIFSFSTIHLKPFKMEGISSY